MARVRARCLAAPVVGRCHRGCRSRYFESVHPTEVGVSCLDRAQWGLRVPIAALDMHPWCWKLAGFLRLVECRHDRRRVELVALVRVGLAQCYLARSR